MQAPLFLLSFTLTGYNLRYVTPVRPPIRYTVGRLIYSKQGKGKTPGEVLRRIDYGGIITTLIWVCESLEFLSS